MINKCLLLQETSNHALIIFRSFYHINKLFFMSKYFSELLRKRKITLLYEFSVFGAVEQL